MNEQSRFSLAERVVVITGSGGILGSAYCEALASRGAHIVLADLPQKDPNRQALLLSSKYNTKVLGVTCNVDCENNVSSLFSDALDVFGRVDVVINNAAATGEHLSDIGDAFSDFENYPLSVWEESLRTNLTGVFLVAREGGKSMLKSGGGSLINVSSIYGVVAPDHNIYSGLPFSSLPSYSASKAGVHGLTQWLSTYWASKNIRVNTLVPGGVYNKHNPIFVERYSARTPMGRMANPDDLIGALVYLATDASLYVTGQKFIIDGGLTTW